MAKSKPKAVRKSTAPRKPVKPIRRPAKTAVRKPNTVTRKHVKQARNTKLNKKTQERSKANPKRPASKKPTKSGVKLAKSTHKKNKQVQYLKNVSKIFTRPKTTRKAAKPARKRKINKKSQSRSTASSKKLLSTSIYSPRLLFLSVVIAGSSGIFYGHQIWVKGYANILGSNRNQTTEAPGRISTVGPRQADPLFSIYPTWSQDFATNNSVKLDSQYWNIFKGIPQNDNHEAQFYTDNPANLHIKNGALSLVATQQAEPDNYKYASARIDTEKKLSFLYGRIDVTAKLPNSIGTWPAVWLLPANTKYEDLGPSSDSLRYLNGGEMDLIEEVGFNPNIVYGTVHTRSDQKNPQGLGAFNQIEVPNNNVQYNKYSLLWTPTSITFEVNDAPFFTYNKLDGSDYTTWSFDQPFYLILNLAMGGKWAGEDTVQFPGNGINNSALPASMDIQSIYYYPYIKSQQ